MLGDKVCLRIKLLLLHESILSTCIIVFEIIYPCAYLSDHCIIHLLYISLPGEVGLAEYFVLTLLLLMFLAADPDYVPEDCE